MKYDCDKSLDRYMAKRRKQGQWHDHFAWFPRRVGRNDCRWFETIERRLVDSYDDYWDYRAKGSA